MGRPTARGPAAALSLRQLYDRKVNTLKMTDYIDKEGVLFYTFKEGVLTISVPYGMEIEEVHAEETMGWTVSKLSRFLPAGKIDF